MTIKDEILEALRSGRPWAEIRANWRSKSQRYEALREYFLEVEGILTKKRHELVQVEEQLNVITVAVAEQAEKNEKFTIENETLSVKTEEKKGVLEEIEGRLASLQAKEFTIEQLEKIIALECESGDTLLSQIVAFKDLKDLKKAVASQKREKSRLEKRGRRLIGKLEKQEKELIKKVASETNLLDELMIRSITYEEAVSTVLSLFEAGFSPEDLHTLAEGLKVFGIAGDPRLSLSRLVEGLRKMKTLYNLNEVIIEETQKCDVLKRETAAAKGKLNGLKLLVNEIKEVKRVMINAIDETSKHVEEKMDSRSEQIANDLSGLISELKTSIKNLTQIVAARLNEWSDVNQRYGKMEAQIFYGQAFLEMLESDEYLQKIPPSVIIRVSERLLQWCKTYVQEVSVKPSPSICQKDPGLFNQFLSYRLLVLIEFVVESLKEHLHEKR